ncbi:MAG: membrane dipeptidase [Oligoflexia bacterium]|nr:membrane dipeptidase [Oligoflexia bacterium]
MIIDFHNDTLTKIFDNNEDFFSNNSSLQIDAHKLSKVPISALFFAIWSNSFLSGASAHALVCDRLQRARTLFESDPHRFQLCRSYEDLSLAEQEKRLGVFFSIEGGNALNDDLSSLKIFAELGVKLITLTHFKGTSWATSDRDHHDRGLHGIGHEVVAEMNRLGIIIDVAHASKKTMSDVAKITSRPIVSSHTGLYALNPVPRSLTDEHLKLIANTEGVVAISFYPEHLTNKIDRDPASMKEFTKKIEAIDNSTSLSEWEKVAAENKLINEEYPLPRRIPSYELIIDHIKHVVDLVGDNYVAIGSDFDGIPYAPEGLEDISKITKLIELLHKRLHYRDSSIEKILGSNIKRLLKSV